MTKAAAIQKAVDEFFGHATINPDMAAIMLLVGVAIVGFLYLAGLIRNRPQRDDDEAAP